MQSIKDVSVVKAVSCNIDGQHTVSTNYISKHTICCNNGEICLG
jgi:hypothetical protein